MSRVTRYCRFDIQYCRYSSFSETQERQLVLLSCSWDVRLIASEVQHLWMLHGRYHPQCLDYTVEQVRGMAAFFCRTCTASPAATLSRELRPRQALGLPPDLLVAIFALLGVKDRCARCLHALK